MKNFLACFDNRDDYSVVAETEEDALAVAIRETHAMPIGIIPDTWALFSDKSPQEFADDENANRAVKALGDRGAQ